MEGQYTIECNDRVVAWFVHEPDRDVCLTELVEYYGADEGYEWKAGYERTES